jgi:RimJ/RimL family protein N-acetyltransferase
MTFVEPDVPRLRGRVVLLEPLALEHADGLWDAAQDPRIWTWFPVLPARDRSTFDGWIEETLVQAAAGQQIPFATVDVASGRPLGSTRFQNIRLEHRVYEIGTTWLAPTSWGTGANAESKMLLLEHAFERRGARRVEFKTEATNDRSRAALAALPARFEGVFRKHMLVRGGENRDSAWYAVTDDDWPDVKRRLSDRVARSLSGRRF